MQGVSVEGGGGVVVEELVEELGDGRMGGGRGGEDGERGHSKPLRWRGEDNIHLWKRRGKKGGSEGKRDRETIQG